MSLYHLSSLVLTWYHTIPSISIDILSTLLHGNFVYRCLRKGLPLPTLGSASSFYSTFFFRNFFRDIENIIIDVMNVNIYFHIYRFHCCFQVDCLQKLLAFPFFFGVSVSASKSIITMSSLTFSLATIVVFLHK